MEIKTITCHDVYNYGASLQAYALQNFLISESHNVEIIDYKPSYLNRTYNFWYISEKSRYYSVARKNILVHLLYSIWSIPRTYATYKRIFPFKSFKRNYLKCTRKYRSYNELRENPPKASVYIAGSDQIWNSILPNGKDPAFYLNFGDNNIKRVSYAASFGISELPVDYVDKIKSYLSVIDTISVREKTGVTILKKMNYNSIEVLDPVFLLNKEDWLRLINPKRIINENYILVYDIFQDNEELKSAVKEIALEKKLKIVSINDNKKTKYADINISNGGPKEFLNLIYNADYVISCSFHATAFSVIFNKKFAVFYSKGNISRMKDFLESISLGYCLNPQKFDYSFDWDLINNELNHKITESKHFIKKSIS